jgi:DNA-binding NtrC family response regulator
MANKTYQQPVVLLIDRQGHENGLLEQWLKANEFCTHVASDIFDALEEINDFTVRRCADVILLEIDLSARAFVEEMFHASSGTSKIQVIAFSLNTPASGRRSKSQAGNITRLKATFSEVLPALSRAA